MFSLIVVPTLNSFASTVFKPRTVKNSWDSLNLVLVLFAIVCGFLSKSNNNNNVETLTPRSPYRDRRTFSNPSTPPPQWYQYNNYNNGSQRSFNRLRSFNSYPDLRQEINADERFRFYDDTYLFRNRNLRLEAEEEEKEVVIENVDTAAAQAVQSNVHRIYQGETVEKHEIADLDAKISQSPPSPPSPAATRPRSVRRNVKHAFPVEIVEKHEIDAKISESPPSPPLPAAVVTRPRSVRRNVRRTYQTETEEKNEENDLPTMDSQLPPSPPPPVRRTKDIRRKAKRTYQAETERETNDLDLQSSQPPPSPPSPPAVVTRTKGVRRNAQPERNDLVVKSSPPPPPPPPPPLPVEVKGKKKRGTATKEFLTSLRGKKKKQRQRSVENFDTILISEPLFTPPSPLPPPPPPKVFQNLFSLKKGKNKKSHIVSVATTTRSMSNKREHYSSYRVKDNMIMAGNESPLIPIPPPPPPPPFNLPVWKFRVQGDYVRVNSIDSSRSGSPDMDDVSVDTPTSSTHGETSQCNSPFAKGGEESASVSAHSLFCPSPDVDTKAHNFIESFRAGLRMAKMNSIKERQGIGRSNLGP